MNVFSDRFEVEFDEAHDAVLIRHPNRQEFPTPLIEIRRDTLAAMSLKESAEFLGERLILLMPSLRELFKDYLWSDDGQQPPKLG